MSDSINRIKGHNELQEHAILNDETDAAQAPLASPAFTGVPTAPTAAPATNTTQIATTAFVLANAGGGEVNTASNVGTGDGLFKTKTGVDLEFKTLIAGTNITLTPGTNDITIDASGGGGGATTELDNLGTTAINADLIFDTGALAKLKTQDASAITKSLTVTTGTSDTTFNSGDLLITTGDVASPSGGIGGQITIRPGYNGTNNSILNLQALEVNIDGLGQNGGLTIQSFAGINLNSGDIDLNGNKITALGNPTSNNDAVRKIYVDNHGKWTKYTFSYTDFSVAALDAFATVKTLAVGEIMEFAVIKHSIQFTTGNAATSVLAKIRTNDTDYSLTGEVDVLASPVGDTPGVNFTATVMTDNNGILRSMSFSGNDTIDLHLVSDQTLDGLTDGEIEVWIKTSTLP